MSSGSRRQICFVPEVTWGTTPGTPSMKLFRNTGGEGIKVARDPIVSAEMRADRAITAMPLGVRKANLSLPFEWITENMDSFLESLMFSAWATDVLKVGVTQKSFTIEEGFTDIPSYQPMPGAVANRLSLSLQPNQIVTGSIEFIGKTGENFTATPLDATPDAAPTGSPVMTFSGSINEGGSPIALVTGLELTIDNGLEAKYALFNPAAYKLGVGRANIRGTISAYFDSHALANKFLQETETSLVFVLEDGTKSYTFDMAKVKFGDLSKNLTENDAIQTLQFQALHDATKTALQITRDLT